MKGIMKRGNEVYYKAKASKPEELCFFCTSMLYLIGLKGFFRVLSFFLNQTMVRYLTIEQYGLQRVQFHIFTTTILFISREGFRCGCLRPKKYIDGEIIHSKLIDNNSKVLAVAWLTVPWGIIVTMGEILVVMWWQGLNNLSYFDSPMFLLAIATILELCSEPLYILAQHLLLLRLRMVAEGTSTISRCIACIILIKGIGLDGGLAFAYAQLAYSVCLLLCYWSYFVFTYEGTIFPFHLVYNKSKVMSLGFKQKLKLDIYLMQLCVAFTLQSVQKLILQEGEKLMLVLYHTSYNQGIYGMVDKVGSLAVRSIFQPFEESALIMFVKASSTKSTKDKSNIHHYKIELILLLALKLAIYLGLIVVTFGPNFAYVLLRLYSREWSDGDATIALGFYCIYILTLPINGICEAFVQAVVTKKELSSWLSTLKLILVSAIYLCLYRALLCVASPIIGLILANSINMGMRILYSLNFIRKYFSHSQSFSLWKALPNWRVLIVLVTSAMVTYLTKAFVLDYEYFIPTATFHVGMGLFFLFILFVALYKYERLFLQEIDAFRNKKND